LPFAIAATAAAWIWPLLTQGSHPHPRSLFVQVIALHLAAAVFGAGIGTLLVPPLIQRTGWRVCLATALFVALIAIRPTPMTELLRLSTNPPATAHVRDITVTLAAAWLAGTGAALTAVTAFLAARLP
jgi:hypothetical protein